MGRKRGPKRQAADAEQTRQTLAAIMPTAINAWRAYQIAQRRTQEWLDKHPELAILQQAEMDAMHASNDVGMLVDRLGRELDPVRSAAFFAHMRESRVADAIGVLAVDWTPEEVQGDSVAV